MVQYGRRGKKMNKFNKTYNVIITERLEKKVQVEATSLWEAEEKVADEYYNEVHILTADDFADVDFTAYTVDSCTSTIDVLLIKPNQYPTKKKIGNTLADFQDAVGGIIQVIYPFGDAVALVLDEEGKFKHKNLNRALRNDKEGVYDFIAGDFLVVGIEGENFCSLSEDMMNKYAKYFFQPEMCVIVEDEIIAVPLPNSFVVSEE